jgi:HlyD family secretion protein
MKKQISVFISLITALGMALSACSGLASVATTDLKASGTISARETNIAPQMGGQIISVSVEEGTQVQAGDELFRLDDSLLQAQRQQAEAAVETAQAAQSNANAQYDLVVAAAQFQEQQGQVTAWLLTQPAEFNTPVWYYTKQERITAVEAELMAAKQTLENEMTNLETFLKDAPSKNFLEAEKRLADAQATFLIAQQVLEQAKAAPNNQQLVDFAQQQYDAAKSELDAAQTAYDSMLTSQAATNILEARSRVAVVQRRFNTALNYYNSLLSGDQSLQVKAADAGVKQADAAVAQAKAALNALDIQLEKTVVRAPIAGMILFRNLEVGETAMPGSTVMVVGQLEMVELIVYIPETEYGKIMLGDQVSIKVDSFTGETFKGSVVNISNQAEFTPRNVQTVEGRSATVYAIKLNVPNADQKLKPGMPADVIFTTNP